MDKANDVMNMILGIRRDIWKVKMSLLNLKKYIEHIDTAGEQSVVTVSKETIMEQLQKGLDALDGYE